MEDGDDAILPSPSSILPLPSSRPDTPPLLPTPNPPRPRMIAPRTCPICDAAIAPDVSPEGTSPADRAFPFCSDRCRNVDLLRWSKGSYAIVEPLTADRLLHELGDDPEALEELLHGETDGESS